jgi:hypothetical protein
VLSQKMTNSRIETKVFFVFKSESVSPSEMELNGAKI